MRWLIALAAAGLAAAPSTATGRNYLDTLLKGKVAGSPQRCIFPEMSVRPVVIDGQAIVYRDARYTYVARFKGGCAILREDRRIVTRGAGGKLCANDPVRVSALTGHDIGFCVFDSFTPYRKH
jgi:hypothetical protein